MSHLRLAGSLLALLASPVLAASSSAGPPQQLVKNINLSSPNALGSFPSTFLEHGGRLYFRAQSPQAGFEVYWIDGSGAPPALLADLNPGAESSYPWELTALSDELLLFTVSGGGKFGVPFVSDGTAAGTVPLETTGGTTFEEVNHFEVHNGFAYFFAEDSSGGVDLWRTLGTPVSTKLVESFSSVGTLGTDYGSLASSDGDLYFSIQYLFSNTYYWQLYRTSGLQGTAVMLAEEASSGIPTLVNLLGLGTGLVFAATTLGDGREFWVSDGTPAGTVCADLYPGPESSNPNYLTHVGLEVFFVATDPVLGRELFKTFGTAAGTLPVADVAPGAASSNPYNLLSLGNQVVFAADDGVAGMELWISGGLMGGETLLADLNPGPSGSYPGALALFDGDLYCSASSPGAGTELMVTDGSPEGTGVVIDLDPIGSGDPSEVVPFGGLLYFPADDGQLGRELWVTDGTAAGTSLVADLNPPQSDYGSDIQSLTSIGDRVVGNALDAQVADGRLWTSDGTPQGTTPVTGTDGLSFSSAYTPGPFEGVALGTKAFFAPEDDAAGIEVWVTDGTEAGTLMLADIAPGTDWSLPRPLGVWRGELYFNASSPALGRELYATDGTPAGTRLVRDIDPGPASSAPDGAVAHDGRLYFSAGTAAGGRELWSTDGSSAGTVQVIDLFPGSGTGLAVFSAASLGGSLYFHGQTAPGQSELWRTDGTAAGTTLFADLHGAQGSAPLELTVIGDRMVFTTYTSQSRQLFGTDGTVVEQLTDAPLNADDLDMHVFVNDTLAMLVMRKDGTSWRLIATDGTPAGTAEIATISPDTTVVGALRKWRASSGPHVLFSAYELGYGEELWVTDGTTPGTYRLTDFGPGTQYAGIETLARVGDQILFGAYQADIGNELFSLPLEAYGGWVAEPFGVGCLGSSGIAPEVDATGDAVLGGQLQIAIAEGAPSSFVGHYYSASFARGALAGCALYLETPTFLAAGVTDGVGASALDLAIPFDPALAGVQLWLQSIVVDAGGSLLGFASMTPAVELILGG